jgi:hypothetical protein
MTPAESAYYSERQKRVVKVLEVAVKPPCWICETYGGPELALDYEDYGRMERNYPLHPAFAELMLRMQEPAFIVTHFN